MIQLLPGLRIKVSNKHSTYGRVKVKSIQLFLGKYIVLQVVKVVKVKMVIFIFGLCHFAHYI